MFHSYFSFLVSSRYLSFFSLSTLGSTEAAKFTIRQVLIFLLTVTRSGRLVDVICLSFKIIEEFMHLIFQAGFRAIPFVCRDKFQFIAQFPVDYIPHPIVFTLILFLPKFASSCHYY